MARKLRIEQEGGLYHVINRGNYRQGVFREDGARLAFETTLWEACDRAGWVVHAYCIMGNHYHVALETTHGNLSEGMRWLQSVFANRFNRYRQEQGHLFQGRFKSLLVENRERLAWLCHYIHLNPVRARLCDIAELSQYRYSSYWFMRQRKDRPKLLDLRACLEGAGGLPDTAKGWSRYHEYLEWLSTDAPAQKQMAFERMSKGWVIGSESYRQALVADERVLRPIVKLTQADAREVRLAQWEAALEEHLRRMKKSEDDVQETRRSAPWKVAIARDLKERLMCTNRWLGDRLNMGAPAAVCRYVSEAREGLRKVES